MSYLLFWLALPLLLVPWLGREERIGAATGRLVLAGLGLAALHQGAGTLDPRDLHAIADQSPHDAWFVGITAGAMITGACLLPDLQNWRTRMVGLPLMVAALAAALPHAVPLAVGLLVGALPALLGTAMAAAGSSGARGAAVADSDPAPVRDPASIILAGATVLTALSGPAAFCLLGLGALAWRQWWHLRDLGRPSHFPLLEGTATLLLIGWTWLALTIAGSPLLSLHTIARDAPISPAAAETLALLAASWAVAIAAPWPLDQFTRGSVQLPVVAIVIHLAGVQVTPDGIAHWQPVVSTVLVVAALAGVASGRWRGAAVAIMLLAATRDGTVAVAGAVAMALAPAVRRSQCPVRLRGAAAGVAVVVVVGVLLGDQVLLAVILAVGVASLANRMDRVVARESRPIHL